MTTKFQPKQRTEIIDPWNISFPVDVLWGIYARQSTPGQLLRHQESTEMQTDDLIMWLQHRNVRDNYVLFDADLGLSGTLRIDQRPALLELIRRINAGEIKAVLVYQISRLFRDLTGIQYNTFADDCKNHNCVLVTAYDGMIFNFNNPIHMKMFRFLAETAAEYLHQQIGLLHEARLRKARKGFYTGLGQIPRGYIVDYRKDSPTFKKFIPYPPHANVVFGFLERYYALEGNMAVFTRELEALPYLFPPFEPWVDQRIPNHKMWKQRELPGGGYGISRKGLEFVLTNPVYLGWWIVEGDVISRDNHEPIIDAEHTYLLWYAFDRLSRYTIDGEKNEQRLERQNHRRFFQSHTLDQVALLKQKITTPGGSVYAQIHKGACQYVVYPEKSGVVYRKYGEIDASLVDQEFTTRLFSHLRTTHDFDIYRQWLDVEREKRIARLANITTQLNKIDIEQEAVLTEIADVRKQITETIRQKLQQEPLLNEEELRKQLEKEAQPYIEKWRSRFSTLENTKINLLAEKEEASKESEQHQAMRQFADFQTEAENLLAIWNKKPISLRREFVNLLARQIVLEFIAPHWASLTIVWTHPTWGIDTLYIYRHQGARPLWTEAERSILRTYYPRSSREEILSLLPNKSWKGIIDQASDLHIRREVDFRTPIFSVKLTWEDVQFMQEQGISLSNPSTKCVSTSSRISTGSG